MKIKKCILSLYPDRETLLKVVRDKFDLLITYTLPEIWNFNQITDEIYPKIRILLENRVYFYVLPEKWISTRSGILKIIAEIFNLKIMDLLSFEDSRDQAISVGLLCQTTSTGIILNDLLSQVKDKLNISSIQYLGDQNSPISQICIIIGYALTPQLLKLAKRLQIDTIICTHFSFEAEKIAEELDINLISVTDYIVNLGLLKLTQSLRMEHYDVEFAFENIKPSFEMF